ncbi:MAG: NAD+ synthase [Actinomycetota bacterium]
MRIALAQLNPTVGDLAGNVDLVAAAAARAVELGADLVVAPELVVSGYPPEDLVLRPSFVRACEAAVARLAGEVAVPVIVGSPWAGPDGVRNSAFVLEGGAVVARYDKMALPNYSVFDEQRTFRPGDGPLLVQAGGALVGITICEDIWVADGPAHAAARGGASLVVNLSASPYHLGKGRQRDELIGAFAADEGCAVAYANLVGGQDELLFDGRSLVFDAAGDLLARGAFCAEDLVVCDLDLPSGRGAGAIAIAAELPVGAPAESVAAETKPLPGSELEELWGVLVLGLRDYVLKNGFPGVLLGVSGGIDSALVAALAADALGAERVHAVSMPTRFNVAETRSDARVVAENLGVDFRELPIEHLRVAFHDLLPEVEGLAGENLQARLRGVILMSLSNQHGWLVLTTGNKSEVATGYSTLYGDSVGGFAPIKDVPKTLVHALSRFLNEREGREVIPWSTVQRPPTAELREDQRDDQSLPPYEVLDPVLHAYIEERMGPHEIAAAGLCDLELARRIAGLVDRAEYKRRQGAPGLKVHPIAFGRDRRMPITNRYREEP